MSVTRSSKSKDFVHIGERALESLREKWLAEQRQDEKLGSRRGGSVGGFGFSAGVTAPALPFDSNKYDDAIRVRDYIGDEVIDLSDKPDCGREFNLKYLTGRAIFHLLYIQGDQSKGITNQMAYVAKVETNCDGELKQGNLFLLGAYRNSVRFCGKPGTSTAWTPSTPEGLKYAFHVGGGGTPDSFNPLTGYLLEGKDKTDVADLIFGLAHGAITKPFISIPCNFSAAIHGVLYAGDESGLPFSVTPDRVLVPSFTIYGAPLVLQEDAQLQ
jgi:hypothetical protein